MSNWGGIEAGGTKFVCGVTDQNGHVLDRYTIPTRDPDATLTDVCAYFKSVEQQYPLAGIGLASFGPIDLNENSDTFGHITSTPKKDWRNFNIKGSLESRLKREIPFDTDVNAAVLAEHYWGAARGLDNVVYLTIGTGIGGGVLVNGQVIHGLLHPEIGHMRIRVETINDGISGVCPYHEHCLEGLASGPAIAARWGEPGECLDENHPAWDLEAQILAHGIVNILLTVSPERIILGGGVMQQSQLFPLIRQYVKETLNGYIQKNEIIERIDEFIVPPLLGKNVGLLGAAVLSIASEKTR